MEGVFYPDPIPLKRGFPSLDFIFHGALTLCLLSSIRKFDPALPTDIVQCYF